jgi:antagonist of KipI
MDRIAAEMANALVGNNSSEPLMELHYPASSLLFDKTTLIAITGADFCPYIDGNPVANNHTIIINAGNTLHFTKNKKGARTYIAIHGGWKADFWLNSYSTNSKASAGGYKGAILKKGDLLKIKKNNYPFNNIFSKNNFDTIPLKLNISGFYTNQSIIRCTTGSEFEWLTEESKNIFQSNPYKLTIQSDRMGYRLQSDSLSMREHSPLLSSGVTIGTIQFLPNGQLIVLMADHQTTGGYPKIGHVISADIHKLAQLGPNSIINFKLVSQKEAEQSFLQQRFELDQLKKRVAAKFTKIFSDEMY